MMTNYRSTSFREASRSFGKRYLTIRIEDIALVENPIPAIETVLNFLEIGGNDDVDDRSSSNRGAGIGGRRGVAHAIAERVKGRHAAAYGGNKFTPALRAVRLVELFGNESRSGRDGEVAKRGESSVLRALRRRLQIYFKVGMSRDVTIQRRREPRHERVRTRRR